MRQAAPKIRSAPRRAWHATARTARWAGGGVAAGPRRAAGAVAGVTRDARERVRDGAAAAWDRSGGARLSARARSSRRAAIAWAVGAILVVAWIGWAIYVTTEHGSAAGLGVLISWPAAIAALALVAAPFVALYLLVQRLREPALAGPAGGLAAMPEKTEDEKDDGGPDGDPDADDEGDEDEDEDEDREGDRPPSA